MWKVSILCILSLSTSLTIAQRVAPGINPGQYQQTQYQQPGQQHPPPPQYQQQPPQHHLPPNVNPQHYQPNQQVPVQQVDQYGNVIQQQQQQHIPQQHQQQHQQQQQVHQQQPQHQQPHHDDHGGHGGHGQPVLHTGNLMQEKDHIAEHMEVPIDTSKMTEQELQFHYFKMHDADNNNKLDGCELIKSLIHWHEQGSKQPEQQQVPHVEEKIFSDEELNTLIDPILSSDDLNKDGFIDYPEFIRAQQKAAASNQQNR
ncbi:lymphotoxin beta receptor inhibitor-like isoform X2 [Chironomus tepperi]|uniref:lymphotoxin beta receptor inhibitor-like isoform X2 n=1 Tax=Chironomus tepperi TaxID=113505 RepID=UPI00391F801E